MTQENTQHRYSITDILGAPCSEEEARRRIREETDLTTLNVFHSMQTAAQETSGIHYGKTWTCHYLRHGIPARIGSKREPRKTGAFAFLSTKTKSND